MNRERLSAYVAFGGLLMLVAGTGFLSVRSSTVALPLVIAGVLALGLSGVVNARAVLAWGRSRSARYGANAIMMTVFFTAILVIVQAISMRNTARFDLTRNQRYTLAPQTVSVLETLATDVSITAFFRFGSPQRALVQGLLDLYSRHASRLASEIVDPDRRPDVARSMGASYDEIVVTAGDRTRVIDRVDEEQLTNAIIQVTRATLKSVYFVVGHSEKNLQSTDLFGYAAARRGLENQGFVVHELSLLDVERLPDDCEALVVAGPGFDYIGTEVDRIATYLRRGGSVVFLLEPRVSLPNIEALLGEYGVTLPNVEMLDEVTVKDNDRAFGPRWTKVLDYPPHAITRRFAAATFYPGARPVRLDLDPDDLRFRGTYLAIAGESAWGESDASSFTSGRATRDDDDLQGPLAVAAVLARSHGTGTPEDAVREARIVVFGDSDFINNANFGLLGNSDLFLNVVSYMAHDEDLIAIRPRERVRDRVFITERQGRLIFVVCFLFLPLSVVTVGATVFVRRRKA